MSSQRIDEVTKLFRCILTEIVIGIAKRFEIRNKDIEATLVLSHQGCWTDQKNGQHKA